MFGSAMLDIAIGVVFVFLLLSVFATTINELIFSLLSMRAKELLRGIQTLLNNNDLVKKVYEHGQVFGLYQGNFDPDLRLSAASPPKTEAAAPASNTTPLSGFRKLTSWYGGKRGNLPSYIPSRNFALALIDSIAEFAPLKPPPPPPPPADQQPPANPQGPAGAPAIQGQQIVKIAQEFKDGAKLLADNPATAKVGKPLLSMISAAGDDAAKLQQSIEEWFNSGMDRVSGWYKYNTQWCLFWIGLTIAIAINADTIHIVKQLSSDSTLRQSIVAAAQSANQAHNSANPPAGDNKQNPPPPDQNTNTNTNTQNTPDISKQIDAVQKSFDNLNGLGVPLGWPQYPNDKRTLGTRFADCITWVFTQPSMMLGWLLSAIAISLGAPFWFDALNKIMIVRSTIKPGEKSPDGKPKDKSQT